MFQSAYKKLTIFYVAILMALSLLFSVWLYTEATRELQIGLTAQSKMAIGPLQTFIEDRVAEGRQRVLLNLVGLNMTVLIIGSAVSYVLARRTMRPIEEAMAAQDRFTADASHEFRTPLTTMKAEIEVALRSKSRSKKETDTLLQSNLEEIGRLSHLADGLLTLAQTTDAQHVTPIRPDEALPRIIRRFMPLAKNKSIRIRSQLSSVRSIRCDENDFDKIMAILLDNAIKYSLKNTTITVSLREKDGQVVIRVADQGRGIAAKDLPHVFERFYRADSSRSHDVSAGYGLGLPIAKKLVLSYNGDIIVQSKQQKGATFILTFPVK